MVLRQSTMKLSVVMAVRDGEPYLRDAIESVLAQSFADFEFIVVDDASLDDTRRILAEYVRRDSRMRVLHNERPLGPYRAANRALEEAVGDAVARHDADDVSPPERFAIQIDALGADVALVTGAVEVFGGSDTSDHVSRPPPWQPRLEWELLFHNAIGAGAHVMFPRIVRHAPVLFPAVHPFAEDYALWCHLSRAGRVVCPEAVIYRYRRHRGSITSRHRAEQDECVAQIRRDQLSQYLQPDTSIGVMNELGRFWTFDGARPLAGGLRTMNRLVLEAQSHFLPYVQQRYGSSASARLEGEIGQAFNDRLGYWLFRSIRSGDLAACGDLLSMAGARGAGHVCRDAGERLAAALFRWVRHPRLADNP